MTASFPPVCILTAGKGSRMGDTGKVFNKATFPLGDQAVISRLMAQFPQGTEFVIGLGYKGEQVRNYVELAHPNTKVSFVEVDNWDGEGSGPGYSLLCCKEHLQRPFFFLPADTLFNVDWATTPLDRNWMGVAQVPAETSPRWCNVKLDEGGRVVDIKDKQYCEGYHAFNGLLFVHDHEAFWQALASPELVGGEHQISNGSNGLVNGPGMHGVVMDWTDIGTEQNYRKEMEKHAEFDFSKTNEAMYFVDGSAVKFFANEQIAADRVAKAALNPAVFPKIDAHKGGFYRYGFVPGETLYKYNTPQLFARFLEWMQTDVWQAQDVPQARMRELCMKFYKDKTLSRLMDFDKKYPDYTPPKTVNGQPVRPLNTLLAEMPWESLCDGVPVFFHGDLQFDNIIYNPDQDKFVLLDWRQDFGGEVAFGDLYYDLGKLYGGLILNYDYIKKNLFFYDRDGDDVTVDFATRYLCRQYRAILEKFIAEKNMDATKVRLMVAVIYLNMSPLHHAPFDLALHALGTMLLDQVLSGKAEDDTWLQPLAA